MFHSSELSTVILSSIYLVINITPCLFSIFPVLFIIFPVYFPHFSLLTNTKYLAHDPFIELGILIVVFNYINMKKVFNYIDTMKLSIFSGLIHETLLPLHILSQSFDALFCGWMCAIEFTHESTFTSFNCIIT